MRHDYLDRYSRIESPIHQLPATVKVVVALGLILASIISPTGMFYVPGFVGVLLIFIVPLTQIPASFILRRIIIFEPFVIALAALMLFQSGGRLKFVSIVLKSTVSLLTMLLLSNTVPFNDLLRILRRAHVPAVIVTILALMYRYIFVLIDEMERLNRARQSRTFSSRRRFTWYSLSLIIGQLFVRSTQRAERVFGAMSARGWK